MRRTDVIFQLALSHGVSCPAFIDCNVLQLFQGPVALEAVMSADLIDFCTVDDFGLGGMFV